MKNSDYGYDIIGDIHGMSSALEALLHKMGYRNEKGVWEHPTRQAVFAGDLIDRGPGQMESVLLVRRMVEHGSALAVQGNHEFNAVSFATLLPDRSDWMRTRKGARGPNNFLQADAFLKAVGLDTALHHETIDWFRTIPLWLDLGDIRVVHACWSNKAIQTLKPKLTDSNTVTFDMLLEASVKDTPAYLAVETLLKGPEIQLENISYFDPEGIERTSARYKWWAPTTRLVDAVEDRVVGVPDIEIMPPVEAYVDSVPVFYGHYWRKGEPSVDSNKLTCVDYSACIGGNLTAYRWSGETDLSNDNFVWVA